MLDRYEAPTSAAAPHLNQDDRAKARSLLTEAKAILDESLTLFNEFSKAVVEVINENPFGIYNPPTKPKLQEGIAAIEGGIRAIRRKSAHPAVGVAAKLPYVAPSRILELQIGTGGWDTKRLVRMLQELNSANQNGMHMATAMLVRAIVDHVPPIFSAKNFTEVANNIGGRSIGQSLKHLDNSLRSIADNQLHAHIRPREVLPSESQVDFRQDLDVLLQEVLRVIHP
jgi:hypothetical protein